MTTATEYWTPEDAARAEGDASAQAFAADVYDAASESLLAVARSKANIDALKSLIRAGSGMTRTPEEEEERVNTAAHEYLLALARDPKNLALVGQRVSQGIDAQLGLAAKLREQFAARVPACGHALRHWFPKEGSTAAQFVADPEQHGECLICQAVGEALRKLQELNRTIRDVESAFANKGG